MTPGMSTSRRKQVTFGAQVVDNESKKPSRTSRSGIPNDCPGKFPSPWTPKTDVAPEAKSKTKLTAALQQAKSVDSGDEEDAKDTDGAAESSDASGGKSLKRSSAEAKRKIQRKSKQAAQDDTSKSARTITSSPAQTPSSLASGSTSAESTPEVTGDPNTVAYWKARYESYAEKSERETRRLIKKNKIAKAYAKAKDAECSVVSSKLEEERKRHKTREHELATQTKDYKERLRQALAENARCNAEIAALKKKLADSEPSSSKRSTRSKSPRKHASPEKQKAPEQLPLDIWEDEAAEPGGAAEDARESTVVAEEPKENHGAEKAESNATPSTSESKSRSRSRSSDRVLRSSTKKEAFPPNRLAIARAMINEKRAQRLRQKESNKPVR